LYGEEGKEGVIVITTKANADEYKKKNPRKPAYEGHPLFTQAQVPAEFPGGLPTWSKYLERNLDINVIRKNGGPAGKYTVVVTFIVDKSGNISDITAENDPGYGTKEEAIRVIEKGPRWKPAIQNGETVIYRHRQSITFFLSETDEKKRNQRAASQKGNPVKVNAFSPAEFPGGEPAWQQYLQRNLNRGLIVEKGGPPGKYSVLVEFMVSKNGGISNVKAIGDPGYGTKEEAIKMIEKGPKWKPAVENAVNIDTRSSKRITWVVSESDMDLKSDGKKESVKNPKKTEREIVFEKKLQLEKVNTNKTQEPAQQPPVSLKENVATNAEPTARGPHAWNSFNFNSSHSQVTIYFNDGTSETYNGTTDEGKKKLDQVLFGKK
jgi:hypothetical protein